MLVVLNERKAIIKKKSRERTQFANSHVKNNTLPITLNYNIIIIGNVINNSHQSKCCIAIT